MRSYSRRWYTRKVANADRSNGYDAIAHHFIGARDRNIGGSTVREWSQSLPRGASVLDLGCGFGEPISRVLIEEGFNLYGVDASPRLVDAFRSRFPNVPVECATVEESSFFDQQFDAVVAWGLIFLLPEEAQAFLIQKVAVALHPGGRFLFTSEKTALRWEDSLTDRVSISLGSDIYRALIEGAGLTLTGEASDVGENAYYFASKGTSK
jgi:2-polyprenyl-3-methyl-5-hydroxy-6-metoxy-1,4-benzoquinol methylase